MTKRFFFPVLIILLILAAALPSFAAAIDDVRVEGNRRIPDERVLPLALKPGDEFDLDAVDVTIRSLYETGYFADIQVDLSVIGSDVVLTYIVREKPFVNSVTFVGRGDVVGERTLRDKITLSDGARFDREKVEASMAAIIKAYEEEYHYFTEVDYELAARSDGSVDVIFSISAGPEAKVYNIDFYGNNAFSDEDLQEGLPSKEKGFWSFMSGSGRLSREDLSIDRDMIIARYLQQGYTRVLVSEPEVVFEEELNRLRVIFRVEEGPQFSMGRITISGNVHRTDEELREVLQVKTGELFNVQAFQDDIRRLTDRFTTIGYAYANVEPRTTLDPDSKTIDVEYVIDENILVHINRIIIDGNTKTRDRVIRREFEIVEGELYNSFAIAESRRFVENTGYFEAVQLRENPVGADRMDLGVTVAEQSTGLITAGLAYSTVDKLVGTVSVEQKNLLGAGYTLTLKSEFSEARTDYNLSFTNSALFDRPVFFGIDLYNLDRSYLEYTKRSKGGALRLGHSIIRRKLSMHYRLAYDEITIRDVDANASDYVIDQIGTTTTVSFTPSIVWNTLNHPMDPTAGNKSSLYYKHAGDPLGGQENFYKTGLETSQYIPLFWKFVGLIHIETGYVASNDGKPIPVDERFRLGGMYSIRGFSYGDISPLDDDGERYGGDKFFQSNLELSFPISEASRLKGVVFVDVGQVYDNGEEMFSYETRESAGLGFRWFSPLGPLRFEYSEILDRKPGENDGRWDFSIGSIF